MLFRSLVKTLADTGACRPDDAVGDDGLGHELSMKKVHDRVLGKGFTEDQWLDALQAYTSVDVSFSIIIPARLNPWLTILKSSGRPLATAQGWCLLPLAMMNLRMIWTSKSLVCNSARYGMQGSGVFGI